MKSILKNRKLVYLLFLLLPLLYYLLYTGEDVKFRNNESEPDYFYFSVLSSAACVVELTENDSLLSSWELASHVYKNLHYVGEISEDSLTLSFNNLTSVDTISLLGLNVYRNNILYSLFDYKEGDFFTENADVFINEGSLSFVPKENQKAVVFKIKPLEQWYALRNAEKINLFIIILIALSLVLLFVISPKSKTFALSLAASVLLIFSYKLIDDNNCVGRIEISADALQKNAELFYNQTPFFNSEKKYVLKEQKNLNIPLNLCVDKFIRYDADESTNDLKELKLKIKTGMFYFYIEPSSLIQKLVLNDIRFENDVFEICGHDPYISFASVYFLNKINNFIALERSLVLFMAILVFFVLLFILRSLKGLEKIKFKCLYLWFLLLPMSYVFITMMWTEEEQDEIPSQIYFSARSSQPSILSVYNGHDSLAAWEMDASGYKYFHYKGGINYNLPLHLKLEGMNAGDTVSVLSVNLYKEGEVYNLFDKRASLCGFTNARHIGDENAISVVKINDEQDVLIHLLAFNVIENDSPQGYIYIIVILLFLISFIIVLLISPVKSYFVAICFVSTFFMFTYFWVSHHWQSHLILETTSPLKSMQFFYNSNPEFIHDKKNDINSTEPLFKTEVELFENTYLRCDIVDSTMGLDNLNISLKTGIIQKIWDYNVIASENILLNDILKTGNTYQITGEDPFILLTSAHQFKSIKWMAYICQNIFLLLTTVVFLVLIILQKFLHRFPIPQLLLVVVFVLIITYAFFMFLFTSKSIILAAEMRYAHTYPEYHKDSTDVLIQNLDNYLKDQLPGRTNIIVMNNLIEYNVFKQIINNPNVHFGKDGWMFYIGGVCRENYENRNPLTQQELEEMTDVLLKRRDWLKRRGIEFYFMFPPMAYFVYEDEVGPRLWRYHKKSKVEQLYDYVNMHTDLNFIDLQTPLKEAKKESSSPLFFKTNSHWNYHGSYIAYTTLIHYLRRDFPQIPEPFPFDSIPWVVYDKYIPDLYKALALDSYYGSIEYEPIRDYMLRHVETTYPIYEGFSSPAPAFCLNNKNIESPSVLLYGDSYAGFLYYYLAQNFGRGIYLWTPLFYPSIIDLEKPDIVVQEMNDYSIMNLLYPNPSLPE